MPEKKRRDKSRILMTDGLNPASLIGMAQKPAVIARSGLCQGPSESLGSSLQAGASYPLEEEEERDMKRDRKWGTERRKSREREMHRERVAVSPKLPCDTTGGLPIAHTALLASHDLPTGAEVKFQAPRGIER